MLTNDRAQWLHYSLALQRSSPQLACIRTRVLAYHKPWLVGGLVSWRPVIPTNFRVITGLDVASLSWHGSPCKTRLTALRSA